MSTENNDTKETKPVINESKKSSMEILSELFSTFDAEPPLIIKKEKKEKNEEGSKKSKKSKKKHKHKEKKHKKKSKKKRRSSSFSSSSSSENSEIDLAKILIKQEKDIAEKKIKIEGTELSMDIPNLNVENVKKEKKTEEAHEKLNEDSHELKNKIVIKDLKYSSVFESALSDIKMKITKEENEDVAQTDEEKKHRKKHKHDRTDKDKVKRSRSRERSRSRDKGKKKLKIEDLRNKIKSENKHGRDRSKDRGHRDHREKDFYRGDHKSRDRSRAKSRERAREHRSREKHKDDYKKYKDEYGKELEDHKRNRHRDRENSFYKEYKDDFYKSRDKDDKWFMRDRYRGYDERDRKHEERYRGRSRSKEDSSRIDKKKLLEIARKNAIQMMKSGSLPGALTLGPQAQEKVIAAIKSGGKTIEELTDFCKTLSKKEELGELSSNSEKEESDTDEPFHHPFQIKDRPTSITMNIKNSVPLPIKSTQERSTELRIQFPVSSGQQHRKTEEWKPVSPSAKKADELPKGVTEALSTKALLPIEAPPEPLIMPTEPAVVPAPPNAPPGPQAFPTPMLEPSVDIGSIVSQRLTAMRKLQENPHDVQALTQMYKSNKEMQSWAESKQQLGQFTGSTGVQILSQAELSSGSQAWAKKNQLQSAAPVSGGMGMHLLKKMGWNPGEGLGKEKTGTLEPLLLEVKLDKKGLVANEEQQGRNKKKQKSQPTVKTLAGKHPVSLLGEYSSKKKLGPPQYILEFECGPDHKKNFLFKVVIDGIQYKPNVASCNKKEAKANAATVALQQIGLLP